MIVLVIAASSESPGKSLINDLSIFSLFIGSLFKYARDEYPVPKSSIAIDIPKEEISSSTFIDF